MATLLCSVPYNALTWTWDTVLAGAQGAANVGRAATEGASEGIQRLRGAVRTSLDVVDGFHPWLTVPLRIVGRLCTWIVHFFRAFVFLWATLYLSIVLWIALGLAMYPTLVLERSPDTMVAVLDLVVDIVRVVYNVLAAAWNFCLDLARPLVPLWNLYVNFWARCVLFLVDTVGSMIGVIGNFVADMETGTANVANANAATNTRAAAGFNMDGYLNVMVPIGLFFARLGWIMMDVFFMINDVIVQFMLQIILHVVNFLVRLLKLITCCQVDGGCCFQEFLQLTVDLFRASFNSLVALVADFELFGGKPLSFLKSLQVPEGFPKLACDASDMTLSGDQCKCADAFSRVPPCQPCTMRCAEGDGGAGTYNWIKECPGASIPVEIIEPGWCSVDPPEGLGPKPAAVRSVGYDRLQVHRTLAAHDTGPCYYTCAGNQRYRRCAPDFTFDPTTTYGACTGALVETDWTARPRNPAPPSSTTTTTTTATPAPAPAVPAFQTAWDKAVHAAARDPQCAAVVAARMHQKPASSSDADTVHFDLCVAQHGWRPPPRWEHHVLNRYMDGSWPQRVRAWAAPITAALHHPRLSATLHATHALVHAWAFHFQAATPTVHHVDQGALRRAWHTFVAATDRLHPGRARFFRDAHAHVAALRAAAAAARTAATTAAGPPHRTVSLVRPRSLFRDGDTGCPCAMETSASGITQAVCDIECPDGTCRPQVDLCAQVDHPALWIRAWLWLQQAVASLSLADIGTAFEALVVCWRDRPLAENPLGYTDIEDAFEGGGRTAAADGYTYCFPQANPLLNVALPEWTFDLKTWVAEQCTLTVPTGTCMCPAYTDTGLFEGDAHWFWVFPWYYRARLQNFGASAQFILTYYLTAGSWLDRTWRSTLDLFTPHTFPSSVTDFWGPTGQEAAYGWLCVGLHLGSALWVMFWGYFAYILYVAFWQWLTMVATDTVGSVLYVAQGVPLGWRRLVHAAQARWQRWRRQRKHQD